VSEESSDEEGQYESIHLQNYLQQNYYESFLRFERMAKEQKQAVVNTFNYNPKHQWHQWFLYNQQCEQIQNFFQ